MDIKGDGIFKMSKRISITKEQWDYIKENYSNLSNKEIANYLGWNIKRLEWVAITKLGLHKSENYKKEMFKKLAKISYQKNPNNCYNAGNKAYEKLKQIGKDKEFHSKGGLATQNKYPNLAYDCGIKRAIENPTHFKKMSNITHNNPEDNIKRKEGFAKYRQNHKTFFQELGRKNLINTRKKLLDKDKNFFSNNIRKINERLRNKNNFIFMNTHFDSNSEKEICKKLVEHGYMNYPSEKVNCHFNVANLEFDFFINNTFIEYHPYNRFFINKKYNPRLDKGGYMKEYYNKRRKVLDKEGYSSYPLMVIQTLSDFNKRVVPYFEMGLWNNLEVKNE